MNSLTKANTPIESLTWAQFHSRKRQPTVTFECFLSILIGHVINLQIIKFNLEKQFKNVCNEFRITDAVRLQFEIKLDLCKELLLQLSVLLFGLNYSQKTHFKAPIRTQSITFWFYSISLQQTKNYLLVLFNQITISSQLPSGSIQSEYHKQSITFRFYLIKLS